MKEIKEFTIDRAKWCVPENYPPGDWGFSINSSLLREVDRRQCCLGMYLSACGVPPKALAGVGAPIAVDHVIPSWLRTIKRNRDAATDLMTINDTRALNSTQREAQITQGFAKQGIKVTFEGDYAHPKAN